MATLTQTALFSKRWGIGIVLTLLVGLTVFFGVKFIIKAIFPPKPIPATVAFGKLPKQDLSGGFTAAGAVTFKVDTISGDLPQLERIAKVVAVGKNDIMFGTNEKVKAKMAELGFTNPPSQAGTGILRFTDASDPSRVLTIEALSGNFKLTSDLQKNGQGVGGISSETVIKTAQDFLSKFDLVRQGYPDTKAKVRYFNLKDGKLGQVIKPADADFAEVSFYRGDIDNLVVIQPKQDEPYVKALVNNRNVVEAQMQISMLELYKFATYPLKNIQQAYSELQAGGARFNRTFDGGVFAVKDVKLGYLDTNNQPYFQPIYIFKGEGDTVAYANAVDDKWIGQNNSL